MRKVENIHELLQDLKGAVPNNIGYDNCLASLSNEISFEERRGCGFKYLSDTQSGNNLIESLRSVFVMLKDNGNDQDHMKKFTAMILALGSDVQLAFQQSRLQYKF